jgi:hypothetical protein
MAGTKRMCCYALQFQHRGEVVVGVKNNPHGAILARRILPFSRKNLMGLCRYGNLNELLAQREQARRL